MTGRPYQLVPSGHHFARTNRQTISQRAKLLRQLIPEVRTIAEICCGDGQRQQEVYQTMLGIESYGGLDIDPAIVALNRANRVACVQGDALDASVMRQFVQADVLFFGPPYLLIVTGTPRRHAHKSHPDLPPLPNGCWARCSITGC